MARNFFGFLSKNKPVWVSGKTKNIPGANWLTFLSEDLLIHVRCSQKFFFFGLIQILLTLFCSMQQDATRCNKGKTLPALTTVFVPVLFSNDICIEIDCMGKG